MNELLIIIIVLTGLFITINQDKFNIIPKKTKFTYFSRPIKELLTKKKIVNNSQYHKLGTFQILTNNKLKLQPNRKMVNFRTKKTKFFSQNPDSKSVNYLKSRKKKKNFSIFKTEKLSSFNSDNSGERNYYHPTGTAFYITSKCLESNPTNNCFTHIPIPTNDVPAPKKSSNVRNDSFETWVENRRFI